jgi:hypothetical protein
MKKIAYRNIRLLLGGYFLISLALFLYSYTQVDLALTIANVSVWQSLQTWFQRIGYFNRPLSAGIFVTLILALAGLYVITACLAYRKKISAAGLKWLVVAASGPLIFAYPAFSYDFFNYMFTAKTVLVYGQNPYLVRPLDFTGIEPWLSFLRWTHLPSAYTPLWIAISLLPYILGLGYFLLIMWSFKILIASAYFLGVYLVYRILSLLKDEHAVFGTALFALNPLVLVEAVTSPHNDILMVTFALAAMYFFLKGKRWLAFLFWAFSVALKLMTIFLLPAFAKRWDRKWTLALMAAALVSGFLKKELLPWYALWVAPFAALNPGLPKVRLIFSGLSFGLVLSYAPFLFYGNYGQESQTARLVIFWLFTGGSVFIALVWSFLDKQKLFSGRKA